ncbi:MAG: SDR family oxidoreductase [Saprospiraceae bacterium]|nr:SDR family oxidoreductase [Saprospiraceae bacterium]
MLPKPVPLLRFQFKTTMEKYALITGAGSGIGRAVSIALLQNGYHVALSGRNAESLQATIELAGAKINKAVAIPADVTSPDSVVNLFNVFEVHFDRLDLLFNNAGVNVQGLLEDISFDQWKSVIDTNLTGAFLCTQEAFKLMKSQRPQGGRIINNGSISASVPRPDSAPYTCSKHAITGLTRSTSLDGRKYNICCGQIDIGNVDTSMATRMKAGILQADGQIREEPTFDIKHVVDAVIYMASLPLGANVQFMTVMATKMPFIGRG